MKSLREIIIPGVELTRRYFFDPEEMAAYMQRKDGSYREIGFIDPSGQRNARLFLKGGGFKNVTFAQLMCLVHGLLDDHPRFFTDKDSKFQVYHRDRSLHECRFRGMQTLARLDELSNLKIDVTLNKTVST